MKVRYLDSVAVDRVSTAGQVRGSGQLQDVVWHVAGGAGAVPDLPPLLPVIQNLPDRTQDPSALTPDLELVPDSSAEPVCSGSVF